MRSGPLTACSSMSSIWENGRTNRQAMFGGPGREARPRLGAAAVGLSFQPRENQHGHRVNR
jgi:hypothetical protein